MAEPLSRQAPTRMSFAQVAAAANRPAPKKEQPKADVPVKPVVSVFDGSRVKKPIIEMAMNANDSRTQSKSPVNAAEQKNTRLTVMPAKKSAIQEHGKKSGIESLVQALDSTTLAQHSLPVSVSVSDEARKKDASDTKSVASRTTLTLDEKESLRPDDSASMQAGVDEDAFSPNGSLLANSRPGSDPGAVAFRAQLQQIGIHNDARVIMPRSQRPEGLRLSDPRGGGILFSVQTTSGPFIPVQPQNIEPMRQPPPTVWTAPPDEKLLDALASPKDRLFVLKVEQDLIDFVKDPKEEFLQLPGTNSFYRMLSHKLADYYMLGHVVDETMSSVRIFRTPHSRLPPPLIGSTPTTSNNTPPPSAQARKIMRRNGDFRSRGQAGLVDQSFDSLTSSKATSDVGSVTGEDGKAADKSNLTREERESRYKEARARIFKDFEVKPDSAEPIHGQQIDKDVSRSSSTSGVKKNRKQKKLPKDDGFEARSAFDPYGRRLSENNFTLMSPNGQAFEQYDYGSEEASGFGSGAPPPNGYGYPLGPYDAPNMNPPGNVGPWMHPGMQVEAFQPTAPYMMSGPMFNQGEQYDSMSHEFETPQFGSPLPESTPKGTVPALSAHGQGYLTQPPQMGWSPDVYSNPYSSAGLQYSDQRGAFENYYPSSSNRNSQSMQPDSFVPYSPQSPQGHGPGPLYYSSNNYDMQAAFNPRSQAFVPGVRGTSNGSSYGPSPSIGTKFVSNHGPSNGSLYMNQQQQIQQQQFGNGVSSYGDGNAQSNNQAYVPPGYKSARGGPVNMTYPTNLNLSHNGRPQQQGSSNHNSSITKWPAPANLPAKPPQPVNGLPNIQIPRDPDNPQPLPPKPIPTR